MTDLNKAMRAEIEQRDWAAVHVAADKRKPIFLPDYVRRWWRR